MNKELEALRRIKKSHFIAMCLIDGNRDIETENAIETIEQALKRNEPLKLKTKRVKVSIDDYRIDDYCPTCDEELYTTSNYCPHCGQKLDWSDDK